MAKAVFHKGQRVFVKPVGTWANIDAVMPHWVKGVEEPLRVTYDVGLGREFQSHELVAEQEEPAEIDLVETEHWRVIRAPNRWRGGHDGAHPHAGTYPVVCTDEKDWGGWRVPMAEYERDGARIEHQARVIANAIRMMSVCRELVLRVADHPSETPPELRELALQAEAVLAAIYHDGAVHAPPPGVAPGAV